MTLQTFATRDVLFVLHAVDWIEKKQRVTFLQELFAEEVAKVDSRFFARLHESQMYRDEADDAFTLFNDPSYNDADYHKDYPTLF